MPSLSDRSRSIILGSILGDGSLRLHKSYKNARFSFRHSIKQKEYFYWKTRQLAEISSEKNTWVQGKNGGDGWGGEKLRFQSLALASLTEIYDLTREKTRLRIRRRWLNLLTPLSLAIWWLDDGSLVSDTRQGVFCTDGFTESEVKILQRYLKVVWKVETTIGRVSKTERFRLWLRSTEQLQKLLRIILPHIQVEQMLPKVILLFRDSNLQQRWISEIVRLSGFPITTVEKWMTIKQSRWKHFRK